MSLEAALQALLAEARRSGDYTALLAEIPYARRLGFRARATEDGVLVHLPFKPELVGNPAAPFIHGGVLGACLEMAAALSLMQQGAKIWPRTIDFTVDYLRGAKPEDCHARAEIVRTGRRVANARMTCWQSGPERPVAVGRGNFQLV